LYPPFFVIPVRCTCAQSITCTPFSLRETVPKHAANAITKEVIKDSAVRVPLHFRESGTHSCRAAK